MIENQTAYYNGIQVMLFPLDYLNCTQSYGAGTYSHCCNMASDWVGRTEIYPYYAPCDCIQISDGTGTADHIATYRSVDEVVTPSGIKRVAFCFMHDFNVPTFTGVIPQGTLIGHTGNAGTSSGAHVHIDQAEGTEFTLIDAGYSCMVGINCFYPLNEISPTDTYYLTGDETVVSTDNLNFTTWNGEIDWRVDTWSGSDYMLYCNKRNMMRKRGYQWR